MLNRSHSRHPRRAGEWTDGKIVTFIVTLAAHRNVTLAAARAGMSRKSAYALRHRDSGFAAAWQSALAATALTPAKLKGNTEVHNPPVAPPQGNTVAVRGDREKDAQIRDLFFANLANRLADSAPPALARMASRP